MKITPMVEPNMVEVTFQWHTLHGSCYDCGCPAAFLAPDRYGVGKPVTDDNKLCCVCAANAAVDGERIERIEPLE